MSKPFRVVSDFSPTGDQPEAIRGLIEGIQAGLATQVLLGVTGSGKTFTIANVIQELQRRTRIACQRPDQGACAQDKQGIRDIAADRVADRDVRIAG